MCKFHEKISALNMTCPTACYVTMHYNLLWFVCLPQEPEDQLGACQGPRGRITHYRIRFQVGSTVLTDVNVNISACTAERCSNTFNLSNVPSGRIPSSYDSVSVAAINAVGMGAARACTSQSISKWNLLHTTFEEYIFKSFCPIYCKNTLTLFGGFLKGETNLGKERSFSVTLWIQGVQQAYLDASFSGALGHDLMMLHIADKITEVYYIIDLWK